MYKICDHSSPCAGGGQSPSILVGLVLGNLSILCHDMAGDGVELWKWGRVRQLLRREARALQGSGAAFGNVEILALSLGQGRSWPCG